ncbi:MAG: hypothetical protein OES84_01060 [Kiritimatiellaceae bacterium]|nr:hypothetical protein [Kiritimatiellaceae bacterium]
MNGKEFSIVFEDRGTYLYVQLTGKDSFAASLDYWQQIIDKEKELGYHRLLVHENLIGEVSEGEIFEIMMDVLPDSTGVQVAFFDENRSDIAINELGHLIATNRGADIRIFQCLEAATNWIEQSDQVV